ncbi:MAG: DNA-directed RNA polymerase subunit A'' [Candidatus Woesearchaeota archaeon]
MTTKKKNIEIPGMLASEIESQAQKKGWGKREQNKIRLIVEDEYEHALVEAGESVGIISAESIGEPSTQMTLNTKHYGGVAELNVTTGLPRIIEILDGRKEIATPSMEVYLKKEYNNEKDVRKIALQVKETQLYEVAEEFAIILEEFSVEVSLRKEKLADIELSTEELAKKLNKILKKLKVDVKEDYVLKFTFKSKEDNFNELYKVKDKLKVVPISGIKGISQVLPVRRGEEFVIVTAGSNIKDIMKKEYVDTYRSTTNDIEEISQYFGIEAARQAIINEVYKVMSNQGLNVDIRHVMLVADTMCNGSGVKGITRYGVIREKSSVLARASFETAINHVINASIIGENDKMSSIVENVMVNQHIPSGTGLPRIVMDLKKSNT